jgi:hypothetical protein
MEFRLATESDDRAIRELLQQIPLSGALRIRYQREPSYLKSVEIQGMPQQTLVGLRNGKIMAVGSRNIQRLFIGGEIKTAGYISNLRYHPGARHGISLLKGIREMEGLPSGLPVDFHYATFISDDINTGRIFTADRSRMPGITDIGMLNTFSMPVRKKKVNVKPDLRFDIVRADEKLMPLIMSFLKKEGARHDFFPDLDGGTYAPALLQPDSFFAVFESGDLSGVCSVADLTGFRQYIMEGCSGWFGMLRVPLNGYYALRRMHSIPRRGEEVKIAHIGFPIVRDDDPEILKALLSHVYGFVSGSGKHYLGISLHEKSPLIKGLDGFHKINYTSRLCIVKLNNDKFTAGIMLRGSSRIPFVDLLRL